MTVSFQRRASSLSTGVLAPLALIALTACGAMPNPKSSAPSSTVPSASERASDADRGDATEPSSAPAAPASAADASASAVPLPVPKPRSDVPVANVAGRQIDVSELLALWLHQDSLQVLESLDHLVLGRLVLAEAARLSVEVEPEKAEKAYRAAVETIETTIQAKRPGITLDRYVDEALGLDPVRYREYLRDEALRGLLAERVVRAWVLQSERAEIRVIVVKTEEDSRKVQEALAGGEEFGALARRISVDSSAEKDGQVPTVVRGETPIARLAFETEVGKVGGPQYEKGAWLYVRVDSRSEPLQGSWKEIAATVEEDLAKRPVADLEVSQWKPVMVERYGVDIRPLMKLIE